MRIPPDAVVDETEFTAYLLVPRRWDDKSGYLRRAGFELTNWTALLRAVRRLRMRLMRKRTSRTSTGPSTVSKERLKVH